MKKGQLKIYANMGQRVIFENSKWDKFTIEIWKMGNVSKNLETTVVLLQKMYRSVKY